MKKMPINLRYRKGGKGKKTGPWQFVSFLSVVLCFSLYPEKLWQCAKCHPSFDHLCPPPKCILGLMTHKLCWFLRPTPLQHVAFATMPIPYTWSCQVEYYLQILLYLFSFHLFHSHLLLDGCLKRLK